MKSDIIKQRFDEKIRVTPACWFWLAGKKDRGYGQMKIAKKSVRAHRYSYSHYVGAIPDGMLVLHKCDTPLCVNPDHLFLGTSLDNAADRDAKGRGNPPIGERAPSAKLKEAQVREIYADPRKHHVIAESYGVSRIAVTDIKNGRRWKYLNLGASHA